MKKFILFAALFTWVVTPLFAQDDKVSDLFAQYRNDERITKVTITSKMFSLFTEIDSEDEDTKELMEAMSKLDGLKILVADEDSNVDYNAMYSNALKVVKDGDFETLMSVVDGGEEVEFMIKESSKGIISELVMLVSSDDNFVLLDLFGEIDLEQVSRLSKNMNVNGMDKLKKLQENQK
jgi:hypothetical protein